MRKVIFIFIAIILVAASIDWIRSCSSLKSHKVTYRKGDQLERERLRVGSQTRACYIELHRATARGRYELLLQRCPGIVEHLALQDLASFLCITPQMLSKIRKNISFGAQK